jgi:archaetidylinositol phosphate synthase
MERMKTQVEVGLNDGVFAPAQRVNEAITASVERRVLLWMAVRLPVWVTSDRLTLLGLGAQVGAGFGYALARFDRFWLIGVIVCLVLNWFGDSMDGTVARVRCQTRPRYGFYVDHMVDIVGSVALMGGLGLSGFVHGWIAVGMLVGFLLLSAESYLATYTLGRFEMSQGIFGPTEIRILLVMGNLALLRSPFSTVLGHRMLLFDLGGAIAAVCMVGTFLVLAVRHTAQLFREEPLG